VNTQSTGAGLAESLEVPPRERNALLPAGGCSPAYPETRLDDPRLAPVRPAGR
jgi:hypothetical protein